MSGGASKRAAFLAALIVFTAALVVYLPSLGSGFVNWDDAKYVYENTNIRSLAGGFFSWAASAVVVSNWHPLTMLSHAVDYAIWGLNPAGHHLTSIVLHAVNSVLVFALVIALTRRAWTGEGEARSWRDDGAFIAALGAALLFALHPLRVESVAWVSERKDVLSALFYLLSVLAYLRYSAGKRLYYALSLVALALALMSKPMAVSLPFVLILIDLYLLKKGDLRRIFIEKVPFFAISVLAVIATFWAQSSGAGLASGAAYPLLVRLPVAAYSYLFYIYKTVFPATLAPYYPYPLDAGFSGRFLASIAALVIISALLWALKGRATFRALWALWLYFLITLLPVIGIVQVGKQMAADRYTYLPAIALFMAAALGGSRLYIRGGKRRSLVAAAFVVVLCLYTVKTVKQEAVWKDSISLWNHELSLYPYQLPAFYNSRGNAYEKMGKTALALADYETTVKLDPTYALAYRNRGDIYQERGELKRAMEEYSMAVRLDPSMDEAWYNRAFLLQSAGDLEGAVSDYSRVIGLRPALINPLMNRGISLAIMGRLEEAASDFERAAALEPGNMEAHYNLGLVYKDLGRGAVAVVHFERAYRLGKKEAGGYIGGR